MISIQFGLVRVQWSFWALLVFAFFVNILPNLILLYLLIFLHELAHIFCAKANNIELQQIIVTAYGVSAKFKNLRFASPWVDIAISSAGPALNVLLALASFLVIFFFLPDNQLLTVFALTNAIFAGINMLPALPLDGGRIVNAALSICIGKIRAHSLTIAITKATTIVVTACGLYVLYATHVNLSIFILACFLMISLCMENYSTKISIIRELLTLQNKPMSSASYITKTASAHYLSHARLLLRHFNQSHYYIVFVIDDNTQVLTTVTETQVINGLLSCGSKCRLKDIVEMSPKTAQKNAAVALE